MRLLVACAVLVAVFSQAAQAVTAPVGFRFQPGETLTYAVELRSRGEAPGQGGTYSAEASGRAVFETSSVRPDGTATVNMACSGSGKMTAGTESIPYGDAPMKPLVLVLRPDGTIAEFENSSGGKTYLVTGGYNMWDVGTILATYLIGSYTMFGLELPAEMPTAGKTWTGAHKNEVLKGPDPETLKVELESEPITFELQGTRTYHEVSCLAITSPAALKFSMPGNPEHVSGTWYFDGAKGRLVGFECHLENWGTDRLDFDYTVTLVKAEP